MENQSADKPFFVSDNAVPGSCLSFISQYNCLVTTLLQEHNKPSWERKFHHSAYFVIRWDNCKWPGHEMSRNSEIPHQWYLQRIKFGNIYTFRRWYECICAGDNKLELECMLNRELAKLCKLAGVPVGGKSSVCLICMKYRIIILIIIIKRPGEILLSYIANTSRMRTHPVLMYPSQHFIIDEIHLLSLTIFAQEALVTRNV